MNMEMKRYGVTVTLKEETVARYEKYEKLSQVVLEDALAKHLTQERSKEVNQEEIEKICNTLLERELIFLELLLPNAISLAIHALERVEDKSFVIKEASTYDVFYLSFDYQKALQLSAMQHNMEKLVEQYEDYRTFEAVVDRIKATLN